MLFQLEPASPNLFREMSPLLEAHWEEIAHFKDIKLNPDWERYLKAEQADALRIFTAREDDNQLIGYIVFFIANNPHYAQSKQAQQDVLFLRKDKRKTGLGRDFILWADEMLRSDGVDVVYHHVKAAKELDFSPLLESIGYHFVDKILARRLG